MLVEVTVSVIGPATHPRIKVDACVVVAVLSDIGFEGPSPPPHATTIAKHARATPVAIRDKWFLDVVIARLIPIACWARVAELTDHTSLGGASDDSCNQRWGWCSTEETVSRNGSGRASSLHFRIEPWGSRPSSTAQASGLFRKEVTGGTGHGSVPGAHRVVFWTDRPRRLRRPFAGSLCLYDCSSASMRCPRAMETQKSHNVHPPA